MAANITHMVVVWHSLWYRRRVSGHWLRLGLERIHGELVTMVRGDRVVLRQLAEAAREPMEHVAVGECRRRWGGFHHFDFCSRYHRLVGV